MLFHLNLFGDILVTETDKFDIFAPRHVQSARMIAETGRVLHDRGCVTEKVRLNNEIEAAILSALASLKQAPDN